MEHIEHVGAVSMGGSPLFIPKNFVMGPLFSLVDGNLCILLMPNIDGDLLSARFSEEELFAEGRLMNENDILSRIRCLQTCGANSSTSQAALGLLRKAKENLKKGLPSVTVSSRVLWVFLEN